MQQDANNSFSKRLRRMAIAIAGAGIVAALAVYAKSSADMPLAPPAKHPEGARQSDETRFARVSLDGATLRYGQGVRLAIVDASYAGHVEDKGAVQSGVPGPFYFASSLGSRPEVVWFRQGQGSAVLELRKVGPSALRTLEELTLQGLTLQGLTMPLGDDEFPVSTQAVDDVQSTQAHQVADAVDSPQISRLFDVQRVHAPNANTGIGTTFPLTQEGLYLFTRPAVEMSKQSLALGRAN